HNILWLGESGPTGAPDGEESASGVLRTPPDWNGWPGGTSETAGSTQSARSENTVRRGAGEPPRTEPSGGPQRHGHRPPAIRDRHPPPLHDRGRAPLRPGEVGAARRAHHELP